MDERVAVGAPIRLKNLLAALGSALLLGMAGATQAHEIGVSEVALSKAMGIAGLKLQTAPQDIHSQEFAEFEYTDAYGRKVLTLMVAPSSHYPGWRDVQASEAIDGVGEEAFIVRRTGLMCARQKDHGACISLDQKYFRGQASASIDKVRAALRLAL
ncbi:hypothetical protein [Hydrogenophaga sp. 5NK40-0174]|uniref:hypothetical protein n=1 Tax=Hydrogenophaga sp. 5NK40-0174 TaxID=3127649 RepID=UPI00310C4895